MLVLILTNAGYPTNLQARKRIYKSISGRRNQSPTLQLKVKRHTWPAWRILWIGGLRIFTSSTRMMEKNGSFSKRGLRGNIWRLSAAILNTGLSNIDGCIFIFYQVTWKLTPSSRQSSPDLSGLCRQKLFVIFPLPFAVNCIYLLETRILFVFTSKRIYLLTDSSSSLLIVVKLDFEKAKCSFLKFFFLLKLSPVSLKSKRIQKLS